MRGASVTPTQHSAATGTQVGQALRSLKLHKRPRILTTLFLWLFGLYAVFLSPAPIKITDDKLQRFEKRLDLLAKADRPRQLAQERWLQKDLEVRKAKEWFWRFKAPARKRVYEKQAVAAEARQKYTELESESQKLYSNAKAELGLWSDAGVDESRQLFWKAFESGKVFGRRQTFWDGLVTILTSREEGLAGMLVQFIIQAMINFTTGMCASVIIFVFQLPSFVWSYQPNIVSGMAFFLIAAVGAVSVVAGFLLALYGAGAAAVYSIATINPNHRLGQGNRRRPIRHHYD